MVTINVVGVITDLPNAFEPLWNWFNITESLLFVCYFSFLVAVLGLVRDSPVYFLLKIFKVMSLFNLVLYTS